MSREDFLKRRAAVKRVAVLAAARDRFATDGFERASMERIAHDAQVSTATLYRHFPSKIDLFQAVLAQSVVAFETELAAAAERPPASASRRWPMPMPIRSMIPSMRAFHGRFSVRRQRRRRLPRRFMSMSSAS